MANEKTWLEYEWRLDGNDALFGVELALYRTAPSEEASIVCYFCCSSPKEEPLTVSEVRRAEMLAGKCVKAIGQSCAGFIQTGNMRQYYFYIPSKEEYNALKQIAEKEKKLICRVGAKRESDWSTYFKLLYPDAAKYQTVQNRKYIEMMRQQGDAITAPRRLNLHIFFKTEMLRLQFEEMARNAGYAIGDSEVRVDTELPHGITLHRISTLNKADIDSVTVRAIRLAERLGGRLIYWDCAYVPLSITKK